MSTLLLDLDGTERTLCHCLMRCWGGAWSRRLRGVPARQRPLVRLAPLRPLDGEVPGGEHMNIALLKKSSMDSVLG